MSGPKKRFRKGFNLTVTVEMYQTIFDEAQKRDITMAELVREIISKWIIVKED